MKWRTAAACWLLAVLLGTIYMLDSGGEAPPSSSRTAPAPSSTPEPAYTLDPAQLESIELERAGTTIRVVRRGTVWEIREPAGKSVSPGLLDALINQLVDGAVGERIPAGPRDLSAFGLTSPRLVITANQTGARRVTIAIGSSDPTETAAYGRVVETGEVFLVGLNLLTYADMLFDAVR